MLFAAGKGNPSEMCSFPENKIDKYTTKRYGKDMLAFNRCDVT